MTDAEVEAAVKAYRSAVDRLNRATDAELEAALRRAMTPLKRVVNETVEEYLCIWRVSLQSEKTPTDAPESKHPRTPRNRWSQQQ